MAARLARGALKLDEALRVGMEIASALDAAHRAGIVHRDLKPGNVMLTKAGAKLLDFGLAKTRPPVVGAGLQTGPNVTASPTMSAPLTAQRTILGTFQYMAPEQLEGQDADRRTDIFAFGAVLYEMLTGKKAFEGKSQAGLIGAIMHSEPPPISTVQPLTPPALDRVVKKCLAKEPDERWQTAKDLHDELKWIAEAPAKTGGHVSRGRALSRRVEWLAASALFIALILTAGYIGRRTPPEAGVIRMSVTPSEGAKFAGGGLIGFALSPDGHRLAFVATGRDGRRRLWIRALDELIHQALQGTEGATAPFWRPDSGAIGFFVQDVLKRIELSGGSVVTISKVSVMGISPGATWNRDDVIVFHTASGPLYRISASGGDAVAVTAMDVKGGESWHIWPSFIDGGRQFIYCAYTGFEPAHVYVGSLDGPERKLVTGIKSSNVQYAGGYLWFEREGALMAQPFDVGRAVVTGNAQAMAQSVAVGGRNGRVAAFALSASGVLAYQTPSAAARSQLVWFNRDGKQQIAIGELAAYSDLSLSPDGKYAAVSIPDATTRNTRDVWTYDLVRGFWARVTSDPGEDRHPTWSADGSRLVFSSRRGSGGLAGLLYRIAPGGDKAEELLFEDPSLRTKIPTSWSRDGRFLLFAATNTTSASDLWVLPVSVKGKPEPLLQSSFDEALGQFSPDGRWVAYQSNESGMTDVYATSFPTSGGRWPIPRGGGTFPRWRHDGKELFYIAPDGKLMAAIVAVSNGRLESSSVRALFDTRISLTGYPYDVSADGQRFLINTVVEEATAAPITLVINWPATLKR